VGPGYDGCTVREEGQVDVVRGCRHVDMQTEEDIRDQTSLHHPSLHPVARWRGRLEGRLELQARRYDEMVWTR
jgi:hypothetical protein